jgi:predicted DNA-binding ribbon-helix-helix protein
MSAASVEALAKHQNPDKGPAMCKLLINRNAQDFRPVSRSIRLSGHSTSLRLEGSFWRALDNLARDEGLSTPKLIATLHAEASELLHDVDAASINLASVLRTACLLTVR